MITITGWTPKDAKLINNDSWCPSIERFYVKIDGKDTGYIQFKRTGRSPVNFHEKNRYCHGEDQFNTVVTHTLDDDFFARLKDAAIVARMRILGATDRESFTENADELAMGLNMLTEA